VPGAIATLEVSRGARTFREPPSNWTPGWSGANSFAGSAEPLAGDLVRDGVAGVASYVAEPLIGNTFRPHVLFPAYIAGYTAVESYYLALPLLSWQAVIVADPLSAPFAPSEVPAVPAATINPETGLPAWYSDRLLKVLEASGTPAAAAKAVARAEARLARDDVDGAMSALEEAVAADPASVVRRLQLADMYERQARYDKAIAQYRQVVSLQPKNAVALNNLAYALAIREHDLQAALPLAEEAKALAPGNPAVLDTLGWIYFLSADPARAAFHLTDAARLAPDNPSIGLHLVEALAAAGRMDEARTELTRVLTRHPELSEREDVVALKNKLL
jgi:tetratricopeptide (TPR) repeat protein